MIHFQELEQHLDEEVSLRGFLYQTPEGKTVLASQPNLKSCCVGSDNKAGEQVIVAEEMTPSDSPVTLHGVLVRQASRYELQRPVMEEGGNSWPVMTLLLVGSAIVFLSSQFFKRR